MSTNSVSGRFRDIEIAFSIDETGSYMRAQNLVPMERHVRVMYQRLATSGLANWKRFRLGNTPVSFRLPTEVLDAYRLTFFVDGTEPISTHLEAIVAELEKLKVHLPTPEPTEQIAPMPAEEAGMDDGVDMMGEPDMTQQKQVEKVLVAYRPDPMEPEITSTDSDDSELLSPLAPMATDVPDTDADLRRPEPPPCVTLPHAEPAIAPELLSPPDPMATDIPARSETPPEKLTTPPLPETYLSPKATAAPLRPAPKMSSLNIDATLEFKAMLPLLTSALEAQQKARERVKRNDMNLYPGKTAAGKSAKEKKRGLFGQVAQAFGFPGEGKRDKAYYQQKGDAIQDDFQDKLSKLEKDYNEGYGLNLTTWTPETLSEEETAILLLNLMVNEVTAWQKETGRATPETKQLVGALAEVDTKLRQTLKQTRGISTPSPTLFQNLLAENERDLEKIQNECNAYLERFAQKLMLQERKQASKIEVVVFKKFLLEFVRDFLFVEIAKITEGTEVPKRLTWFLDLADFQVIPIEIGETRVDSTYHKLQDTALSEFETGTIVEVLTPGLQSKDGKWISQKAVVIQAE